ncbi:MAG: hypothetical protein AUG51_11815 [Acidobacteria bacterium 13_1_20CM_3_53_8]|nr:MAG: hypothetical protein AUG51_11815 [Acidobacteria bacterium 13_1_20CM_3_53_8]
MDVKTHHKGIEPGAAVVLVLHSPREKYWGVLDEISAAGLFLKGLDLNAFEDWVRAIVKDEPFMGPADLFFPMWRVERVTRDEREGEIPSLAEQVEKRTGRSLQDVLYSGKSAES